MTPPKDYPVPKKSNWLFWLIFWIVLVITILWLCIYFFPDLEASQPREDYLDKPTKTAYQTLASRQGHTLPPFNQMPIYTKANSSWVGIASWYSIASLKKEGTYKYSKGVMANGKIFSDNGYTCATRLYPLGTYLYVTNIKSNKTVKVKVTDRIGKRFAKTRIDLSKLAFSKLDKLEKGIIQVKVELVPPFRK